MVYWRRPRAGHGRGFTLVELLVVMVIIAVLVGLLLPAIMGARARARAIHCQSNLRQIGIAMLDYHDHYNGVFPPLAWEENKGNTGDDTLDEAPPLRMTFGEERIWVDGMRWNVLIGPFVEGSLDTKILDPDGDGFASFPDGDTPFGNEVFVCPETQERVTSRNSSYGYNYHFLGNDRQFRAEFGEIRPHGGPYTNFPVGLGAMESSTHTVLVADSLGTASGYPEDNRQPWTVEHLCGHRGDHAYALDPPVPYYDDDGDLNTLPVLGKISEGDCEPLLGGDEGLHGFSAVDARHRGRAQVVFVDGHVGSLTPEELGYVVREDGSFAYGDINELFRDLNGNGVPDRKDEWLGENSMFTGAGIHKLLPQQFRQF